MKLNKSQVESLLKYNAIVTDVFEGWEPFEYQRKVFEDLFILNKKYVFCNWPRKSGKSEVAARFLILKALMINHSTLYYVCETRENAEQVIWSRLQQMIPAKYLQQGGFRESTKEVRFNNGSIIKLYGSNSNKDALIGTSPDSLVYDEYRTHKSTFHDVMMPNVFKKHCQILIISTPPDVLDVDQYNMYKAMEDYCKEDPTKRAYTTMDCWHGNPQQQEFYKELEGYYTSVNRYNEFRRECLCEYVKGTVKSMFPEFQSDDLIPHSDIMDMVRDNRDDYIWCACFDTSGWKRWGALFAAIHKRDSKVYILDSIAIEPEANTFEAREQAGMSAKALWPTVEYKLKCLYPNSTTSDWDILWDPADVMIMDDVKRMYGEDITIDTVNKRTMGKSQCLNLIRDMRSMNKLLISDRAAGLITEFQAMKLNPQTEAPEKKYDELIDCLRYIIYENEDLFDFKDKIEIKELSPEAKFLQQVDRTRNQVDIDEDIDLGGWI